MLDRGSLIELEPATLDYSFHFIWPCYCFADWWLDGGLRALVCREHWDESRGGSFDEALRIDREKQAIAGLLDF